MWRRLNLQEAPDMHISGLGVEYSWAETLKAYLCKQCHLLCLMM